MVEIDSENETTKLSSKINVLNKNVKTLIFSIDKLMEKLDNTKPVENTPHCDCCFLFFCVDLFYCWGIFS